MAIKHLANLDLNNNQIENVRIDVVTSDPTGLGANEEGRIIYNSQDKEMKYWSYESGSGSWVSMKNTDTDVDVSKDNLITRLASFNSSDTVNIGDADDDTTVVIRGNLQVDGTTTTVNSATLNIADNIITLNDDVTGTPTENAGIEVERGTSTNVSIRWNESSDKWQFTNDGTTYTDLGAASDSATTEVEGIVELATDAEALGGSVTDKVITPSNLAARSFAVNLEDSNSAVTKSTNTYTVTHGLATKDVMVQVYETGSPFETVQVDIARPTTGTITVAFADAVTDGEYRVLINKID